MYAPCIAQEQNPYLAYRRFNPHPFATFPLPLSLGFRGVNECMDVKLEDESFPFEEIISRLNGCLPRGLRVFDVTEPVMKAGKRLLFASFTIKISCDGENSRTVCEQLKELLTSESIEVEKKSKKGIKTVDIKQGIKSFEVTEKFDFAELDVVLSAGSSDNVNRICLYRLLKTVFWFPVISTSQEMTSTTQIWNYLDR